MKTLSEQIRECKMGAAGNHYQGNDRKVLFVCSMGILRSATAARMYAHKYNTRSAGSFPDALIPLSPILLAWAEQIVFVNKENYLNAKEQFGKELDDLNVVVLDIPDCYPHMDPMLQRTIREQYSEYEPVTK